MQSDGSNVFCYSDMTCNSARINYSQRIEASGAYSLHEATITTQGQSLTLDLYGYYAGYNAVLNCESGDSCTINCYGNACYGLQLNCDGTCTKTCDESSSTDCPITYGDSLPSIPSEETEYELDIADQSLSNMDSCETSGAITYGDSDNPATSDISTSSGNICCQSANSCDNLNIEITGNGYDIVCGGKYLQHHLMGVMFTVQVYVTQERIVVFCVFVLSFFSV